MFSECHEAKTFSLAYSSGKVCRVCMGCKIKREKVIGKLTAVWSVLKEPKWKSVGAWLHWNACPTCELCNPDGFSPSEQGVLLQLGWLHPTAVIPAFCCVLGARRPPVPGGEEEKHGEHIAACAPNPGPATVPWCCAGPPTSRCSCLEASWEPYSSIRTS